MVKKERLYYAAKNQFVVRELDSEVFNNLVIGAQPIPGMGQSAMDKVKSFMKDMPDTFTH